MIEKDDLVAEARRSGKRIHTGHLMTICSIKFYEMHKENWKCKGRSVFRCDDVRDKHGAPAAFQEMSASPTGAFTTNSPIAYGAIPGNCTQVSDAVRAYIQAKLGSQYEIWVLIPP